MTKYAPIQPGVVTADAGTNRHGSRLWVCACDCGGSSTVVQADLRSRTRSCGCLRLEVVDARLVLDLTGKRYGRLLVIGRGLRVHGRVHWRCLCDCGAEARVSSNQLQQGKTRSCGCLKIDSTRARATTHGHTTKAGRTKTYCTWSSMIARCTNPKDSAFANYGGRGIQVCERWLAAYQNFLDDLGERPRGKTLDRMDVNGNYEPGNCRWATATEQSLNRRMTRRVLVDGNLIPLAEFAAANGVSAITAANRARCGWDYVSAGTVPGSK